MKTKQAFPTVFLAFALAACGGDSQAPSSSAAGDTSGNDDSGVLGFVEFDGERHDLAWTSCANRPESNFQRWLADDGDDVSFQFQRYDLRADEEEHRYTMNFSRRGVGRWENVFFHRPTISITEEAVEGHGFVYPTGVAFRDREDSLVPIRFEFRCIPRS